MTDCSRPENRYNVLCMAGSGNTPLTQPQYQGARKGSGFFSNYQIGDAVDDISQLGGVFANILGAKNSPETYNNNRNNQTPYNPDEYLNNFRNNYQNNNYNTDDKKPKWWLYAVIVIVIAVLAIIIF